MRVVEWIITDFRCQEPIKLCSDGVYLIGGFLWILGSEI